MHSISSRRAVGVLATLMLVGLVLSGTGGPAQAEDGYRYWNYYYEKAGAWEFSQKGAAQRTPEDGSIEAYRYGTSLAAGVEPRADLGALDFAAICAASEAASGEKRVGVLLDFGTDADAEGETPPAPRGECAVVAEDASGQQVLEAVADLRVEGGLTCAVDGYPLRGCGTPVAGAQVSDEQPVAFDLPAAEPTDGGGDAGGTRASDEDGSTQDASAEAEESGPSGLLWLLAVGAVVVVIGAAAFVLSRRNRSA